jgi:predicted phosphodiesterase
MRVLLLTDTHGKIDQINAFAAKYNAQACIHCGDIGLFDYESIRSLPAEELTKIIRHSPVSEDEKIQICSLPQAKMAEFLLENHFAGTFEDYLVSRKKFDIPVYAVWGNHENIRIVNWLRKNPLPNLTFLDETTTVVLGKVRFYGIGGDFHSKHLPMAEKSGIPWVKKQIKSAFWQYRKLVQLLDLCPSGETRVQITHCDPLEVSFLQALSFRCKAALTCSGHMHRKEVLHWQNTGKAEELLADYVRQYPELNWHDMLKNSPERTVHHLNLPASFPLLLEIDGSDFRVPGQ